MYLSIEQARKSFGSVAALDGVTIGVDAGEFVCLLGPSGCGKTTLLRIVAGLLAMDSGRLTLGGRDLSGVPARQRGFGIVFQSYSLFPNMTVADNIGYGLKIRRTDSGKIARRVSELLELIKLPQIAERFPWELSGGQQQRVALARAIAAEPALLLLDEPLSALDARVRADLREEIRDLQRRLGIPTIMVTHDQEEALTLSDRIVCMNSGRIEQAGSPDELYLRPATRFVANFMGISNLIPHELVQAQRPDLCLNADAGQGGAKLLCVRPEKIRIKSGNQAEVMSNLFLGNVTRLRLKSGLGEVIVEVPGHSPLVEGMKVDFDIAPADCAWVNA